MPKWTRLLLTSLCIIGLANTAAFAVRPLGLDTSYYCPLTQTEWNDIYASGRTFGWTRASYGYGGTDSELDNHMTRATNAGLVMGVYHFSYPGYSSSNTPVNEANTLINTASEYITGGYLLPVLDVEYNSGSYMGGLTLTQWCTQFLDYFEQETGVRPLVYSGQYFARDNLTSAITAWPYWIAQWPSGCQTYPYTNCYPQTGDPGFTTPWSTWTFWQYAGDVPILGVTTQEVDLNTFNGTWEDLQAYIIPGGSNPPTITQQPTNQSAPSGGTAVFTIAATGGTLTYQWQKNSSNLSNGGHYSGCTTATLTVTTIDTNDEANYRCIVTNSYGSTTSNQATLTIVACATPTLTNGTFEYSTVGSPPYGWSTYIQPTKSANFTIQTASPPQGTRWQQTQVYSVSSYAGVRQNVTNLTNGAVYTISGTYRTNSTSATAAVRYNLSGNTDRANSTVLVSKNSTSWGTFSANVTATGSTITLFLDHLNGTSSNKASGFDNIVITMTDCPSTPTITQQPTNQSVAAGGTASFIVAASGSGLTYQWQKNSVNQANGGHYSGCTTATLTISTADTNDAANYRCVVSNEAGSATSNQASLTVTTCSTPTLTNGNFEAGTVGNPPSGWTTYIQSSKSGNWTIQTVTPPQGTLWQQTQVYNASSFGGIRQNVTGLTSGAIYTISGTYKTNSTSATAAVRYNLGGNSDRANSTVLVSKNATSWGTFSADVTASGSSLMLFLDHLNGTSTNKASAFDNIKVVCKP